MSRTKTLATLALSALGALALLAPAASADSAPAWQISLNSYPANFAPGALSGESQYPEYAVIAENVGAASTTEPITITVQLPSGISPSSTTAPSGGDQSYGNNGTTCSVVGQSATCVDSHAVDPGEWVKMIVPVDVAALPDPTVLNALATISSGTASATTTTATTISATIAPLGLLAGREGFNSSATEEDGTGATQAASHPQQLNINVGLPSQRSFLEGFPVPDGTLHDVKVDLPAGLVVDPSATEKCTAAEFQSFSCPDATQVGISDIPTASGSIGPATSQIYNLQAPPGHAAAFGFYVLYVPITILGGVRADDTPGKYRITSLTAAAPSILAVFQARLQFWGSPSDESHDRTRGECRSAGVAEIPSDIVCPVSRSDKPLLSLPTSCTESMRADAHIDLWENIGAFFDRSAELEDANGNKTAVDSCNQLQFNPTLKARPTTNVADSPTGLEADLRIPQTDSLKEKATAHLKDAVVTLPEGVAVNPSGANGLAGCSSGQIGIDPGTGVPNDNPVACPAASRIGSVEVDTPLLEHSLPGSVFVASPNDNPFHSLLAIYVVVDDQQTDTLIKLAGHVVPDPNTGQLTATFADNPQLPFSDFKLNFFGGATAALRTPATCGTYSTTSSLTPWSAPASGPPATPSDTWSISQSPSGTCASNQAALPNSPSFEAGSASPIAAAHTPFVLNLKRDDATQQFSSVSLVPPPGLLAKLAGTSECSDAALAAAAAKSGNAEKAAPSCPASSQIGTVQVGAGAGPSPYYAQGTAYLTGPYKGAPLGMAIVTPATAGPYDLGTVVVRTALNLDPVTTKITAVSDQIPTILQGIPLDVRSARVSLDRPDFTLNGTSCEPFSVDGTLVTTLGQSAALSNRFQLGECRSLAFAPKLSLRLKGATKRAKNPRLIANLTARPGEANIARAQVKLPKAAFLDNAHIRTICTRVQCAADTCPAKSVYGKAWATSPLLDYAVHGKVYLRSSDHPLPDLLVKLRGPATQPIVVELAGKTDSVKGSLRNTFEAVPDVPVSKFHLELFGGKRGLVELSRNLCKGTYRANVRMDGQNGATYDTKPKVANSCKRKGKKHSKRHRR